MIPFMAIVLAAGSGPQLPGTVAIGGTGSGSLTTSISINSDGSITTNFTGHSAVTLQWYSPVSSANSPGAYYYVSFHKTAGTAWSTGLTDGTVYALGSARALAWTTSSSVAATVIASFWLDAGGTQAVGTFEIDVSIN